MTEDPLSTIVNLTYTAYFQKGMLVDNALNKNLRGREKWERKGVKKSKKGGLRNEGVKRME